jgi:hypothetical protein
MPLTEPNAKTVAAAALVRAGLADDKDAGVLIIQQNGAGAAGSAGGELEDLVIALTALAVRTVLAASGWNVGRALAVIDAWTADAAAAAAPGPSHQCPHQASNFTPCAICGA